MCCAKKGIRVTYVFMSISLHAVENLIRVQSSVTYVDILTNILISSNCKWQHTVLVIIHVLIHFVIVIGK